MAAEKLDIGVVETVEDKTPAAPPAAAEAPSKPRGVRKVKESFFHGDTIYRSGTTVRAGHPIIEQFPQFFHPAGHADVELPEEE